MADLSSALTPSVTPDKTAPDDTYHINATPDSFGGLIAQGAEKAGAGVTQTSNNLFDTSKFFGQVAADNASNDYQDFATKLLHGDPSKMVPGPDGTPQPDTGYLGLRGRAALDARPGIAKELDDQLETTRATLQSPEQQLQFDNFSRRYRSAVEEKVGSHADDQAKTWYQGVNTASAKIALDHISMNADNPQEYLAGEADLVHAYVKTAQLNGAQPGDELYTQAVDNARRDALKARLDIVAVKDPSKAQAILDQPGNKAIAGAAYDNLSSAYRGRAKQQQGYDVSDQFIKKSYESNPAINPVTLTNAGLQYGVSGSYLMRVQQMETGANPNQTSPTGAQGPFQFIPSTAHKYGLTDPFNYAASADAAAHLAADNKVTLTASLGRPPSDQELYLAHNQGAEGASLLLAHPNQRAGDLVGDRAIRVNGGDPNAPAAAFTSMLSGKFNNAPVAASSNRKNQVIGDILAIPNDQIDPDVREHAIRHAEQTFSAQAIAEESDARSKKAATDKMQGDFTARIIKGDTNGIIGEIAQSGLPANEMQNLYKFAIGDGGVSDPLQYGPAYSGALKRILASPDAPDRIDGPRDLIQMGAEGQLTKKGVDELVQTQTRLAKNPDQAGIATVKSHQLDYYKSQFSIDQEMTLPGMKPYKSQKGLDRFNHDFVPAFESAYSQWTKPKSDGGAGKDPMEFLNDKKQMDAIMDRVYPPAQRAADAISAEGGGVDDHQAPPAPQDVDAKAWINLMKQAPYKSDGSQWSMKDWGGPSGPVAILRQNPTPQNITLFNQHFGDYAKAEDVLKAMPPKGYAAPATPAERLDRPAEPGILSKAVENAVHYGKTGHAPSEGYTGDSPVPLGETESPVDRLIRESKIKPEPQKHAEAENPMVVKTPVQVGIRG